MRWISDTRRRVLLLGLSSAMNTLRIATTVTTVVTPFVLLAKHSGAFNGPRLALLLPPIAQRTARTAKKAGANKVFGRDLGTGAAMAAAARESRARNLCGRPQRRISTIPLQMSANFDFETPIDRWGTGSLKWEKYAGKDVIPLWVSINIILLVQTCRASTHTNTQTFCLSIPQSIPQTGGKFVTRLGGNIRVAVVIVVVVAVSLFTKPNQTKPRGRLKKSDQNHIFLTRKFLMNTEHRCDVIYRKNMIEKY